jgi:hypothetical protein
MRWGLVRSVLSFLRYSGSQVFAGKFAYFIVLAVVLFLGVAIIHTLDADVPPTEATAYYFLLVPGMVLVFYPAAYGIQNDADAKMLETLFGIPDYRYKVWLVRQLVQLIVIGVLLGLLTGLCGAVLADIEIGWMVFHLMFPIAFVSCGGLLLGALFRSGNGAAVGLVILVLFFWIASQPLSGSPWSLFYNPFAQTNSLDVLLQADANLRSRAYLAAGSILALLGGLLRLQNRERFI